ncbi:MAG: hypothetical protein CSB16_00855 [Clostridiales bacterium]|nr:MAG: hypothetical protein CSB16_00855 [Clostridiales bacterium]
MDILNYTYNEQSTFDENPLNAVDVLSLCQFCMIKLEIFDYDKSKTIGIKDLLIREKFDDMNYFKLLLEKNINLLFNLASSPRFREIKIIDYENIVDDDRGSQFSATTYLYEDKFKLIAFRGTDNTISGWKEDFGMSYSNEVPSQKYAKDYLDRYLGDELPIYVAGHSKGGNLAYYAAAKSDVLVERVYCFDNPGYLEGVISEAEKEKLKDISIKFIPDHSVVGLILNHDINTKIIITNSSYLLAHDAFTWAVHDRDFVYTNKLTTYSEAVKKSLEVTLESVDEKTREKIVETVFLDMKKENITTLQDMTDVSIKSVFDIGFSLKDRLLVNDISSLLIYSLIVVIGVLEIVFPNVIIKSVMYLLMGFLGVLGIVNIKRYFTYKNKNKTTSLKHILFGIVLLIVSVVSIVNNVLSPVINPSIFGVILCIYSFSKIKYLVIDTSRDKKWWEQLFIMTIAGITGVLTIVYPIYALSITYTVFSSAFVLVGLINIFNIIYNFNK